MADPVSLDGLWREQFAPVAHLHRLSGVLAAPGGPWEFSCPCGEVLEARPLEVGAAVLSRLPAWEAAGPCRWVREREVAGIMGL